MCLMRLVIITSSSPFVDCSCVSLCRRIDAKLSYIIPKIEAIMPFLAQLNKKVDNLMTDYADPTPPPFNFAKSPSSPPHHVLYDYTDQASRPYIEGKELWILIMFAVLAFFFFKGKCRSNPHSLLWILNSILMILLFYLWSSFHVQTYMTDRVRGKVLFI